MLRASPRSSAGIQTCGVTYRCFPCLPRSLKHEKELGRGEQHAPKKRIVYMTYLDRNNEKLNMLLFQGKYAKYAAGNASRANTSAVEAPENTPPHLPLPFSPPIPLHSRPPPPRPFHSIPCRNSPNILPAALIFPFPLAAAASSSSSPRPRSTPTLCSVAFHVSFHGLLYGRLRPL